MKLAALDSAGWWAEGRDQPLVIPWDRVGPTIAWWFEAMRRRGVDVLYIHRSALELLQLPGELEVPAPGERRPRHPWLDGVTFEGEQVSHYALTPSIECRGSRSHGLEILIGAYQDGAGDPFDGARDGRELLAAVAAFRDAFVSKGRPKGWAYRNSAIQTGWKLLHAPWQRGARRGRLTMNLAENPRPELEGLDEGAQVEVPYGSWATTGGASYPVRPWVLAWDVNGQRLAATARLSVGVGGLEHRTAGEGEWLDMKQLPGYHRITAVEHPHAGAIPPVFDPGWHTTPRVAMAAWLGIGFELAESWVWTERAAYLNPWYEAMRDARARLLEVGAATPPTSEAKASDWRAAGIALGALKQSYLQPLGRLRSARAREQGGPYYRPDWYDHVIGQELAREYLRLHQLAELRVPVLAVYFDTIIIESDTPDLIAGAPEPLQVSSQLGKFKPLGALPAEQARHILYGGERSPDVGALVKALKAAGGSVTARPPGPPPPAALSAFTRPAHAGYPGTVTA